MWSPGAESTAAHCAEQQGENCQKLPIKANAPSALMVSQHESEPQTATLPIDSEDISPPTSKKKKSKETGARRKSYSNNGYPQASDAEGPLFLRHSDNQLVHLHCCVIGCTKAHFTNITALMQHVADPRYHGFGKGFLKNHSDAVEKCGRPPGENNTETFLQVPPREKRKYTFLTPGVPRSDSVSTSAPEKPVIPILPLGYVRVSGQGAFGGIGKQDNSSTTLDGFALGKPGNELAYSTGIGLLTLGHEPEIEYTLLANEKAAPDLSANRDSIPTTIVSEDLDPIIDLQNPSVNRESSVDCLSNELFSAAHKFKTIACSQDLGQETTIKGEPIDDHFRITTPEQLSTHEKAFNDTHASRKDLGSDTAAPAAESENPSSINAQEDKHNDSARCKRALSQPLCSSEKRTKRHSRASTDNCSFFWQFY